MSTPQFCTIAEWSTISGMKRSKTYLKLSSGELRAVKVGNRTLIDVAAGLTWLRSLPAARFNCAQPQKMAT